MKVLIDACVLYPTFLRELITEWAATGGFTPLWSDRILEEWRRAAARNGPADQRIAEAEIAALSARFPAAIVAVDARTEAALHLPDPDDNHVLAAAIDGGADELLTLNVRDFPTNALAAHDLMRRHPDEFLLEAFHAEPDRIGAIVETALHRAASVGIDTSNRRALLKRARVPRLAKALDQF
ncbi:MAG: PIN domain-containing protein [Rhodobacteraceae bacterium]|nr:MAG: PIN domain-containing protein [Paracoccaceae bacterium]